MKIAVAADHAALDLKAAIIARLRAGGHAVTDCGTNSTDSCDYPDYAAAACRLVQAGEAERAVLVCGTGIGMSIAANKFSGLRCGLVHSVDTARLAASHNRAQVLAIGARVTPIDTAMACVDAWLTTPFDSRHQRRLDKIAAIDRDRREPLPGTAC